VSLSVHNHTHLEDDEVVERFSVRWREYQEVLEHLADASPPRHVLLIARRGMGKSLLLRRLAIAAVREPHRAGTWLPVMLPEELYAVLSIGDLWLAVLEAMATQLGEDDLRRAVDAIRAESDPVRVATLALGRVVGTAEQRGVRLLLLVENLDMLFNEQLTEDDGWALRKTLQNEPSILLIGSAIAPFAQIESHGSALFEFFRIIHLDGLDAAETAALWEHVTGAPLPDGQAEPVRLLTGGNPRMITILGVFATRPDLSGLLDDLELLVDEYTPYFKANIEQLPPVERKIFVTLADLWTPSTAAEVGARARMDSSKVSALLGRMAKRGLVTTLDPEAVPRRYELTERLFQLYHLLRNVEQAGRVHALFDIIRHLFLPQDLHRRIMPVLVDQLGGSPSHVLVASALERHLDDKDEVFRSEKDHADRLAWLQGLLREQEQTLGTDAQESLASRAEIAFCLGQLGRGAEALALFEQVAADSERVLGAAHPHTLGSRHQVAYYLGVVGRGAEALALFEQVAADSERVLGREDALARSARGGAALMRMRLEGGQPMPRELREILQQAPAGRPAASSTAGGER
jgi:DNA-binding MarR family transcriptional regulator